MRIGVDLDNTIIDYSHLFLNVAKKLKFVPEHWCGNKIKLKEYIHSKKNGYENWKKLQGQVYGPFMHKAKIYIGFKTFIERSLNKNHKIFIISHKTKYGHYDETKTPLRTVATKWLEHNKIINFNSKGIQKENLYFFSSRKEKIRKINSLNLDYFIDDLNIILKEIDNEKTLKIHFNLSTNTLRKKHKEINNWFDISKYIYGNLKSREIIKLIKNFIPDKITKIKEVSSGINSNVFKVDTEKKSYACKFYPFNLKDTRNRLKTEIDAINAMKDFKPIPNPIAFDDDKNFVIFDWIQGRSLIKINDSHIEQTINFVRNLKSLSLNKKNYLYNASESCLSGIDIINQIEKRLSNIDKNINPKINSFLKYKLKPTYKKAKIWLEKFWPFQQIEVNIERQQQVLSPSDFGFHNSVLCNDGRVCFIDFEYFGWDDPSKLINDFVWHPGMKLTEKQKENCYSSLSLIFNDDVNLKSRLIASWPLFGVRWCLIILKEYLVKNEVYNINQQSEIIKIEQNMKSKLIKADSIINKILIEKFLCPYA